MKAPSAGVKRFASIGLLWLLACTGSDGGVTEPPSPTLTSVLLGRAVLSDGTSTPVRIEILQPNGGARIDPRLRTWIVVHGRLNSSGTPEIQAVAAAIKAQLPGDQVLLLDWEGAARETAFFGGFSSGEQWIEPVGRWAAEALVNYGFSGGLLNLVGHSWGAYVVDELAASVSGGVDVLVALDPAANTVGSAYNPNDPGTVDFAAHSLFAVSFHSSPELGNELSPSTADEAVSVGFHQPDGVVGLFSRHSWIRNQFAFLISSDGGVSSLFTLTRFLAHSAGPWQPNRYQAHSAYFLSTQLPNTYEAMIVSQFGSFEPTYAQYRDRDGNERIVQEEPSFLAASGVDGLGGSSGPSDLYAVAPTASGRDLLVTRIRRANGSSPLITDLATCSGGEVYAVSFDEVFRVNRTTGLATTVALSGLRDANALACDPGGNLFAGAGDGLYAISRTTGTATLLGRMAVGTYSGDIVFAPDGSLYGSVVNGEREYLVRISPADGRALTVPGDEIGFRHVFGLTVVGSELYGLAAGVGGSGRLISIDRVTGVGTDLRALSFQPFGAGSSRR